MARVRRPARPPAAETYRHPEAESPLRPEVGTQAQFRKKKPPVTYRYDSSLAPELNWDGQNPARESGEALIREIIERIQEAAAAARKNGEEETEESLRAHLAEAQSALARAREPAERLKALSNPFMNWAGKAERLSFDVPTLPLFIHERLSTKAIIETLKGHRRPADGA